MYDGKDKELSRAYLDIINGFTKAKYFDEVLYIKHFGLFDEALIDENYEEVFQYANEQGLPTESQRLEVLEAEGFWTKADERKIDFNRVEIRELETRLSKTIIKAQKEKILKKLAEARGAINQIEAKRSEMLHDTCESFARAKSMNFMIWLSFYKDKEFCKKAWSKEEFDDLPRPQLNELVNLYNLKMETLSMPKIKKISISPIFTNYFYLSADNVADFFGKKMLHLTFFQTTLASYGRMYKNIQENHSDIPEAILNDPDGLLDFAKSKNSGNEKSKAVDSEGGYSKVGATKEDMIDAGVSSSTAKDLHDIAKEKGGSLGWEDFATMR
jgi:hypothetical protein